MTSTFARDVTQTAPLTTRNKIGLAICGLLGAADIAGLAAIGATKPGEQGPPTEVIVGSAVMGVITLVALVFTWRSHSRMGSRIIAAARILSALSAVPAFLLYKVPSAFIAVAGGEIVITLVVVWLLLSRPTSN